MVGEVKETETPKGKVETKASASKVHGHFAKYSASADATMEKAAICPSVQQRQSNSATQLLTKIQDVFATVHRRRSQILHA